MPWYSKSKRPFQTQKGTPDIHNNTLWIFITPGQFLLMNFCHRRALAIVFMAELRRMSGFVQQQSEKQTYCTVHGKISVTASPQENHGKAYDNRGGGGGGWPPNEVLRCSLFHGVHMHIFSKTTCTWKPWKGVLFGERASPPPMLSVQEEGEKRKRNNRREKARYTWIIRSPETVPKKELISMVMLHACLHCQLFVVKCP